jgi:competence ComEA-like helix-hairpin-helix protein
MHKLNHSVMTVIAVLALVGAMGGSWAIGSDALAAPTPTAITSPSKITDEEIVRSRPVKKEVTGKININTATEEQLMQLPTVGPSKAERVVTWRKKNGGFKRTADLRRVKGFGFKTFKRLEPYLDIKGDTTLAPKH